TQPPPEQMERSSNPLSERSYAEAVTGSPRRQSPEDHTLQSERSEQNKVRLDAPRGSSPEIPLSSMPMVSTQEQIEIEKSVHTNKPVDIEVDNTQGRASEDVNALLQIRNTVDGWQTVTPKKNRKKAKKTSKNIQDSNKRPHSDSPLKERMTKRQATIECSDMSGDESNRRGSPSPSPALSISALNYTDEEDTQKRKKSRASITPRARDVPQGNASPGKMNRGDTQQVTKLPQKKGENPTKPNHQNTQNLARQDHREESPMRMSTPYAGRPAEGGPNEPDEEDPELWFETTEGDITTNGKGLRRTATPPGGWPKVYLAAHPAFNIAAETLNEWEDIEEPTIWARLYRAKYEPSEAGKTKMGDMVKHLIKNLVYIKHDESVAVIFPEQDLPPKDDNRFPHPYHLLVVGLDPQQAQRLLDLEVVATSEATVFFLPRNPTRSLYILTIKGLTYNDTKGAKDLVEDLARRTFRTSPEIRAIIESNLNQPTEDELDKVLDIRASFLPIKQHANIMRCWNLYFVNNPEYEDEEYRLLRKKMRACTFKTLTFGKGHALTGTDEQPICTGCKSADHDSYNCPFSWLPGWLGFRPNGPWDTASTTDFADEDKNRDGTRQMQTYRRGRTTPRHWRGGYRGRGAGHPRGGRGRT
ncbi:hypothetical protein C0993_009923, partial [Termitomyces sp. T159_Od127]